jgi:spermidine synthase
VTLSEQDGVRYLHFGTEWVQGAMRIRKPDWPELEYAQQMMAWMLFLDAAARIAQLGLGTATLTKFCYRQFPEAQVTAVELNPSVIAICTTMFKLPPKDERLQVLEMDALDFVDDPANHGAFDVLQCDLYDATARGPVLDTPEFYQPATPAWPRRHHDGQPVRRPPQLQQEHQGDEIRLRPRDLPARSPRRQRGRAVLQDAAGTR